jgi:DNA polymerase-1
MPRKDKVVKAAFVPKLDALMAFDYPNIELKLLAFYLESVGWPSMADVFREGRDLHSETAAGILKKPVDQLTDDERQDYGKVPNFSIVYGGGLPTIMSHFGWGAPQALEFLRAYHAQWPGMGWATKQRRADHGTLVNYIQERVEERGYITTLYGRHLHPRSMHSALNALCQGCAADLIKWAMVRVDDSLKLHGMQSHIVNMVHDDLLLDVAADEAPTIAASVPEWMTDDRIHSVVPIMPEPEVSFTTWADMQPYTDLGG